MTSPCNTCGSKLTFSTTRYGTTRESCAGCGYDGPLRVEIPRPVTFTPEEKALEQAALNTMDCVCRHCGTTFQARRVKPRAWYTEACRNTWRRLQHPRRGMKAGRKVGPSMCPRCHGKRKRSSARPTHPLGRWVCHPCARQDYFDRKALRQPA